jgi:hypothetical protein
MQNTYYISSHRSIQAYYVDNELARIERKRINVYACTYAAYMDVCEEINVLCIHVSIPK